MEFLFWTLVGLASLGLASFALVEGAYLLGRTYSRCSYWLDYHYRSWRSGRQVAALKRRYGRPGTLPLGSLRFTRSRARDFDGTYGDGPPEA
jgi:hypothetical protein